jgi:hypothetical protein
MLPGELLHPSQDLLPLDRVEHVAGGQGLHIIEDDQVDAVDHLDDVVDVLLPSLGVERGQIGEVGAIDDE